jgi:hypothetical protein
LWSAATCGFKGAGVYVGLAPGYEHMAVARGLGAKQMQLYLGGRVKACGEVRPWPINYFAVRDPSAVRVIPVHQPPLPNGFKAVRLQFRFPPQNGRSSITIAAPRAGIQASACAAEESPAGFIVSVGLPIEREQRFFEETIRGHRDQDWEDVFVRIADLGCRDTAA